VRRSLANGMNSTAMSAVVIVHFQFEMGSKLLLGRLLGAVSLCNLAKCKALLP